MKLGKKDEQREEAFFTGRDAEIMSESGLTIPQMRPRVYDTDPEHRAERHEKVKQMYAGLKDTLEHQQSPRHTASGSGKSKNPFRRRKSSGRPSTSELAEAAETFHASTPYGL